MQMQNPRRRSTRPIMCSRLESLPDCLFVDGILHRLDIQTLCSVACVSSKIRSLVSQALTDLPSLEIAEFFPETETVGKIVSRCKCLKSLTVDCLRVSDGGLCIIDGLGPNLEELKLLRSSFIDSLVLHEIGERCPNLRLLVLEMRDCVAGFTAHLSEMLLKCTNLECLCMQIRVRDIHGAPIVFQSIEYVNFLPKTIKSLTLERLNEGQVVDLVCGGPTSSTSIFVSFLSTLQKLSLVLEMITHKVLLSITTSVPHLLELHLQDETSAIEYARDLTNAGLETLRNCSHLKSLFLVRKYSIFYRVEDEGIFHISDGCRELESVRLVGFAKVSDAGFASIPLSCHKLKKFEVEESDLTHLCFRNLLQGQCNLKEVIVKPNRSEKNEISSKIVEELFDSNRSIELLNLGCCTYLTDYCIQYISSLGKLTYLYLYKTRITKIGLAILSKSSSPIKSLSLSWCNVTDTGISLLVDGGGTISKTLKFLDLTYSNISDEAIKAIAREASALTELCIRSCCVTDSSIKALASKGLPEGSCNRPLRKLDIHRCGLISDASLKFFKRPFFRHLWWIGVFGTCFVSDHSVRSEVLEEKPLLTVCTMGCRMGCYKKWNYLGHKIPSLHSYTDNELSSAALNLFGACDDVKPVKNAANEEATWEALHLCLKQSGDLSWARVFDLLRPPKLTWNLAPIVPHLTREELVSIRAIHNPT